MKAIHSPEQLQQILHEDRVAVVFYNPGCFPCRRLSVMVVLFSFGTVLRCPIGSEAAQFFYAEHPGQEGQLAFRHLGGVKFGRSVFWALPGYLLWRCWSGFRALAGMEPGRGEQAVKAILENAVAVRDPQEPHISSAQASRYALLWQWLNGQWDDGDVQSWEFDSEKGLAVHWTEQCFKTANGTITLPVSRRYRLTDWTVFTAEEGECPALELCLEEFRLEVPDGHQASLQEQEKELEGIGLFYHISLRKRDDGSVLLDDVLYTRK